jgi:hypothetical protein
MSHINQDFDYIINPVSLDGVLSSRLEAVFAKRYPANNQLIKQLLQTRKLNVGELVTNIDRGALIINVPVKKIYNLEIDSELVSQNTDALFNYLNCVEDFVTGLIPDSLFLEEKLGLLTNVTWTIMKIHTPHTTKCNTTISVPKRQEILMS